MGAGGPFAGVKRIRGVTLTTHPHLVPRSGMSRSYIYLSPPCATIGVLWDCFTFFVFKSEHLIYLCTNGKYLLKDPYFRILPMHELKVVSDCHVHVFLKGRKNFRHCCTLLLLFSDNILLKCCRWFISSFPVLGLLRPVTGVTKHNPSIFWKVFLNFCSF
jgi:hypothetical protein